MIFEQAPIAGAWIVRPQRLADERGFFARLWCRDEFAERGIDLPMLQTSMSNNVRRGTLRGLHFTAEPSTECKLVRCQRGTIHDVIVDLRSESPTFMEHFAIVLSSQEGTALYVPHGVAHGFQTLVDDCEVHYMMTEPYRADLAQGVRHDDPAFGIRWPLPVSMIHDRDRRYPLFDATAARQRSTSAEVR